jgi:hypothetical protein
MSRTNSVMAEITGREGPQDRNRLRDRSGDRINCKRPQRPTTIGLGLPMCGRVGGSSLRKAVGLVLQPRSLREEFRFSFLSWLSH